MLTESKQVEMHYRIRYYWTASLDRKNLVNFRPGGAARKERASYLQPRFELPSALTHRCFGRYGRRLRSSGIRKITMQRSNLHHLRVAVTNLCLLTTKFSRSTVVTLRKHDQIFGLCIILRFERYY